MLSQQVKKLIISFMLLTFLGQAVAAVSVPCQMMLLPSNGGVGMETMMNHGVHDQHAMSMNDMDMSHDMNVECCNDDSCSMNSCMNVFLEPTITGLLQPVLTSMLFKRSAFSSVAPLATSLYRPPILS